jgi:thiamine biosynthesis protein ThiS
VSTERTATIEITVNGETREVALGTTIADLLRLLDLDAQRLAVELDRQIVRQPVWEDTRLRAGSELEIVQFVGGG